ncbi:unnamed protein product, partial [Iphiclides podalirius]
MERLQHRPLSALRRLQRGGYNNAVTSHDSGRGGLTATRLTIVQFVESASERAQCIARDDTDSYMGLDNAQQSRCHFSTTHAADSGASGRVMAEADAPSDAQRRLGVVAIHI